MKKILATLLAIVMILGTVPALALASSADGDPVALGAIIASAGYGFEEDTTGCVRIPCDFYFGDGDTIHDDMVDIITADPEIVPGTMAANLAAYTFSVSLTKDGVTQTHAPSKVEVKDDWGTYDQGIYFYLADFTVTNGTYTVRIDITTPGGNNYYYEEGGLACSLYLDDVPATAIDGTNVTWRVDGATATLTFSGTGAVPSYSDTSARPWHSIAAGVKRVVVENGVTALGDRVGNSFKSLNYIYLADTVTSLGFDCFAHSGTVAYVRFSPDLASISQGAFYGTTVTEVDYTDDDGETYTSREFALACTYGAYNDGLVNATWINDPDWGAEGWMDDNETVYWAFDEDTGTLTLTGTGEIPAVNPKPWQSYVTQITSVVIGDGLTLVPSGLFSSVSSLDRITLPDTVTTLKGDAFAYCGKVSYVRMSANATKFSQGVFYSTTIAYVECTLTRTEFQANVTSWGNYNDSLYNAKWSSDPAWGAGFNWSFDEVTGTLTVTGTGVMPSFEEFENSTRPWDQYKEAVTKVVIAEGVTSIQPQAFNYMPNLETVEMADTVTSIGGDAFAHDGTITTFQLSPNVTTISQGTVYGTTITTVSCTKSWKAIQAQASVGLYNDAYANATWSGVIYAGYLSVTKYGTGWENWTGNGDPRLTQLLVCPEWDGEYNETIHNALKDAVWTITLSAGGEDLVTMHLKARSIYNGGTWAIYRFVPAMAADPAERFTPVRGVQYTLTATVTYDGVTDTTVSLDKFAYTSEDEDPIIFNYYNITWTINGVEEYTVEVPQGFKPEYEGAATNYAENGVGYLVVVPETAAADADATYDITFNEVDATVGTLGIFGNGYENWNGQTQLLLSPKDWQGAVPTTICDNAADYTWVVTINGADFTAQPSSFYSHGAIVRFEPVLWATPFVPQAGAVLTVSLKIYSGNTLVYQPAEPVVITIADDFEPIVPYVVGDINGDVGIDVNDVTALLNILAGNVIAPEGVLIDLDGDGDVTVSDVTKLLNMIANLGA